MCFIGLSARAQPLHPRTISVEWKDSFILEVAWVFHRARTRVFMADFVISTFTLHCAWGWTWGWNGNVMGKMQMHNFAGEWRCSSDWMVPLRKTSFLAWRNGGQSICVLLMWFLLHLFCNSPWLHYFYEIQDLPLFLRRFGPWRGSVASYTTDERSKNDQKKGEDWMWKCSNNKSNLRQKSLDEFIISNR